MNEIRTNLCAFRRINNTRLQAWSILIFEWTITSQELYWYRGSRFSQCLILSKAVRCSLLSKFLWYQLFWVITNSAKHPFKIDCQFCSWKHMVWKQLTGGPWHMYTHLSDTKLFTHWRRHTQEHNKWLRMMSPKILFTEKFIVPFDWQLFTINWQHNDTQWVKRLLYSYFRGPLSRADVYTHEGKTKCLKITRFMTF